MKETLKALSGTVCAGALYLLGGWDTAIGMMFLLMGLDLLTGVMAALKQKSAHTPGGGFLSRTFFLGLTRKLTITLMIMLAAALDRTLGTQGLCRLAAIGFYTANEGLSIVENAALLGVPFPKGLLNALERLRERNDNQNPNPTDAD
jgi:toxin secretion/phage lysis holin